MKYFCLFLSLVFVLFLASPSDGIVRCGTNGSATDGIARCGKNGCVTAPNTASSDHTIPYIFSGMSRVFFLVQNS